MINIELALGAATHAAPAQGPATPANVQAFESLMDQAAQRHAHSGGTRLALQLPLDGGQSPCTSPACHVSPVEAALRNLGTNLHDRYEALSRDITSLGEGLDLSKAESAVVLLERQARINSANVEFHLVLQTADNIKHGVKSLVQSNG